MLFNSAAFLCLFLPAAWVAFQLVGRRSARGALWVLLGFSALFYAYWSPPHLLLLLASVLFNYAMGHRIAKTGRGLGLAVAVNLGALAVFKYADLFARTLGWVFEVPEPKLVLPLAISFFTFQQIAYVVECHRRRTADPDFAGYALFVMFFPQLIAGPIVAHATIAQQIRVPGWHRLRAALFGPGVTLLVLGLFKKICIGDPCGSWADELFDASGVPGFADAWAGCLAYSFQIYFDFSGYSDMAMGLGLMFGLRLPENFDAPYRAATIVDFWRRWHITLSAFLRDYLYIPLGGNRKGPVRRWVNLLITMLLGGLWHGASWTFMGWGLLHGLMLAANHAWWRLVGRGRLPAPLAHGLTLAGVGAAWVLFRAESVPRTLEIWQGLLTPAYGGVDPLRWTALACVGAIVALAPVSWRWVERHPDGLPIPDTVLLGLAAAAVWFGVNQPSPFLYFQF